LGNLDGVGQAVVKHIRLASADYLRYAIQSAKRCGVKNAVTIPLEIRSLVAVGGCVPPR
jgi:hypothetical protein